MKIIISENQLRTLLEQPESRFGPEQYMSSSERAAFHSGDANKAGAALVSGSKKQMDLGVSLLNENYKFVGKTNQENLVFTKNGRQVKVTPRGRII
jgi:hypothetical protein